LVVVTPLAKLLVGRTARARRKERERESAAPGRGEAGRPAVRGAGQVAEETARERGRKPMDWSTVSKRAWIGVFVVIVLLIVAIVQGKSHFFGTQQTEHVIQGYQLPA
jgi:hypothetical protein